MNRILFTASQWQELEHQALIFKYIVSGIPVPSDLLFSLHTTCAGNPLFSKFLSPQSQHAWSCFQMGKKIDPEPGRCRRTDGKKWRCGKEAYTDSKYCERHMHRGKNRSRKHVEVLNNTPSLNPSLKASSTPRSDNSNPSCDNNFSVYQDFRNRYTYGVKDGVDEHAFFCEPSGTMRSFSASSMENSWPLAMNSFSSSRPRDYSYLQLQNHGDEEKQNHLFHGVPLLKNERGDEPNKTTHRFFDEEPILNREWDSSSTTRLSISTPSSSNDYFPLFNSTKKPVVEFLRG